ncbi:MAG TPA: SdiA-regulated domain-containing protein [Pseudomonas sp.]|nr:SdiA-regulated domain-containing protein [Pseudomonas sp.]
MLAVAKHFMIRGIRVPYQAALLCVLVVWSLYFIRTEHLDDRLYFWMKTHWNSAQWHDKSVWLPAYRVEVDAKVVPGIANNLSGLSFDPDRDLLWAVTNGPNLLLAMSLNGDVVGRYPLEGFHDVEAVSYLGDGMVAVVEERRQNIVPIRLPLTDAGRLAGDRTLHRHHYQGLQLALGKEDNKGFEGLAYDLKGDRLYVAKERDPRQLLEITGIRQSLDSAFSLQVKDLSEAVRDKVFATDLSSVVFDQRSGHLVLLSDESKLLIEMTDQGQVVSFRSLHGGSAGLHEGIPQAEGVTLDDQGRLYLISEPNLFYRFDRS